MNKHPSPAKMAEITYPETPGLEPWQIGNLERQRQEWACGVATERARLTQILRNLDKGDHLPTRLRDLVNELDAAELLAAIEVTS